MTNVCLYNKNMNTELTNDNYTNLNVFLTSSWQE